MRAKKKRSEFLFKEITLEERRFKVLSVSANISGRRRLFGRLFDSAAFDLEFLSASFSSIVDLASLRMSESDFTSESATLSFDGIKFSIAFSFSCFDFIRSDSRMISAGKSAFYLFFH